MAEQVWWAIKNAPVADVEEWAVLVAMAEAADQDGCNSYLSANSIGERTRLARRTVQRRMDALAERGLIKLGDQREAFRIPEAFRPVVWDLQVPYSYFREDKNSRDGETVLSVNIYRAGRGRPPLTPAMRPDLALAPEKKKRADVGVKRPKTGVGAASGGDYKSPRDSEAPGTPQAGGDYKSPGGRLVDTGVVSGSHPTLPSYLPQDPPHSLVTDGSAAGDEVDGQMGLLIDVPAGVTTTVKVDLDALFEIFHDLYPKKVAPDAGLKAFKSAVKRGTDPQVIIEAARAIHDHPLCPTPKDGRSSDITVRDRWRFMKLESTWLNQGDWAAPYPVTQKWEDDLAASTAPRRGTGGGFYQATDEDRAQTQSMFTTPSVPQQAAPEQDGDPWAILEPAAQTSNSRF